MQTGSVAEQVSLATFPPLRLLRLNPLLLSTRLYLLHSHTHPWLALSCEVLGSMITRKDMQGYARLMTAPSARSSLQLDRTGRLCWLMHVCWAAPLLSA